MKKRVEVVFSSHLSEAENREFIKHISETIGDIPYDVHYYTNFNEKSLPDLYNDAIEEIGDDHSEIVTVFCHNDIILKTKNWGKILLKHFNSLDYQIIGVAGSSYLPTSGRWWDDTSKMVGIVEHSNGLREWVSEYSKPHRGIKPTVIVDGLFMAVDCHEIEHKFDNDFGKFHFYDLPICVNNYLEGYNVGVTTEIRILHKSVGMTNQEWEDNRLKFVEKFKDELPIDINNVFNND